MPHRSPRSLVSHIYDAALSPDLWPATLEHLLNAVGAIGAGYGVINRQTGVFQSACLLGPLADTSTQYLRYFEKHDVFKAILNYAPVGCWLHLRESVPSSVLKDNEWYNDFLMKARVDDGIAARLFESAAHTVVFGISHAADRPPFASSSTTILEELRVPLGNAARLHSELLTIGWKSSVAHHALDKLTAAVMITDSRAHVIDMNQAAQHVLRRADGLVWKGGKITALHASDEDRLAMFIAAVTAVENAPVAVKWVHIQRKDGYSLPYILTIAPLREHLSDFAEPLALVIAIDPDARNHSAIHLADCFELSPAEARLAQALLEGKTLREIAVQFGVKITTLRSQLSAIMRKVGVQRQVDLIRIISAVPMVAGIAEP
jgi:DNA-binding CsgD family transcriptional regulator